ncbi:unnamed protein product [Caenorhabditis sp. 36 PRJEB53466]|nr:unnamed protein product [Caenorhabditis sp. 36 PRJEB53466]
MGKLTNVVLAGMIAAPFVIRYFRKKRLEAYVQMKPEMSESDEEIEEENEKSERPQDHYIRIPSFAVAAVIGKRGQTLRRLMYDSQTECVIRSYTPEELDVAEYL